MIYWIISSFSHSFWSLYESTHAAIVIIVVHYTFIYLDFKSIRLHYIEQSLVTLYLAISVSTYSQVAGFILRFQGHFDAEVVLVPLSPNALDREKKTLISQQNIVQNVHFSNGISFDSETCI